MKHSRRRRSAADGSTCALRAARADSVRSGCTASEQRRASRRGDVLAGRRVHAEADADTPPLTPDPSPPKDADPETSTSRGGERGELYHPDSRGSASLACGELRSTPG